MTKIQLATFVCCVVVAAAPGVAVLVFGDHEGKPVVTLGQPPASDAIKRAFNAGWMACAIDSEAIRYYHEHADALADDSDPVALAAIWENAKQRAADSDRQWNALTPKQQTDYRCEAFWCANKGEPRRISRKLAGGFVDALKTTYVWGDLASGNFRIAYRRTTELGPATVIVNSRGPNPITVYNRRLTDDELEDLGSSNFQPPPNLLD